MLAVSLRTTYVLLLRRRKTKTKVAARGRQAIPGWGCVLSPGDIESRCLCSWAQEVRQGDALGGWGHWESDVLLGVKGNKGCVLP